MSLKARLAKIETLTETPICPLCGTDRRALRERELEFLVEYIPKVREENSMQSNELALNWLVERVPACREMVERHPGIGAEALAAVEGA